eukprot:15485818-Alexandrium_andersonii.AAC.1
MLSNHPQELRSSPELSRRRPPARSAAGAWWPCAATTCFRARPMCSAQRPFRCEAPPAKNQSRTAPACLRPHPAKPRR